MHIFVVVVFVVADADVHQLSSSLSQYDSYVFLPPTGHIKKCIHNFIQIIEK